MYKRQVGASVCPVHCTVENRRSDPDVIWRHRSNGPGIRQVAGFGDRSTGRGTFGANLGHTIVTNGDFTAYVCDSAATWPSSQITLGRLIISTLVIMLEKRLSEYNMPE